MWLGPGLEALRGHHCACGKRLYSLCGTYFQICCTRATSVCDSKTTTCSMQASGTLERFKAAAAAAAAAAVADTGRKGLQKTGKAAEDDVTCSKRCSQVSASDS